MTLRALTQIPESPLLSGKQNQKELDTMTMSKPFTKVAFAVLITLILIVGIYTSVQGAFLSAGTRVGQSHVDAGLNADLSHHRAAPVKEVQSFSPQADYVDNRPHGCHADEFDSSDY
jgi:hypothetical protein